MTAARVAILAAAVVLAGAIPRILLAAGSLPPALHPLVWSDVLFTWERARGAVPYWGAYYEYPPLAGYIAGAFSLVTGSAAVYVALWAALQAALAAFVAWLIAREAGARAALVWSASPQLLFLGSLNFDVLAIAPVVAAIAYHRRGYIGKAAAAVAVGAAVKLFPLALLPVIALRLIPRAATLVAVTCALVLATLYAPATLAPWSDLESVTRYAAGIPQNFDSLWGLIAGLLRAFGATDPTPVVLLLSTAGLLLTYALVVVPATRRAADVAVPAALAVLTLLLWSRLYSPQYSLWAVPFFALLPLPRRAFAGLCLADMLVFTTVFPLTLVAWPKDDPVALALFAMLVAGILLRHIALIAAFVAARRIAGARSATTP